MKYLFVLRCTIYMYYDWSYSLLDVVYDQCASGIMRIPFLLLQSNRKFRYLKNHIVCYTMFNKQLFLHFSYLPSISVYEIQIYVIQIAFLIHSDIYRLLFLTIQKICFLNCTCLLMNYAYLK